MKILLINTNPVVSRLVSLCTEDTSIVLEEVAHVSKASDTAYDLVFVDDEAYSDEVAAFLGWIAQIGKVVYFSGRDSGEEIGEKFDTVLKKPFLPSHIQEIIAQTGAGKTTSNEQKEEIYQEDSAAEEKVSLETEESISIFPLASEEEQPKQDEPTEDTREDEAAVTKVLDSKEIEQIKALLEEEEEEVIPLDPSDEEAYEARKIAVITQKLEEEGLEIVPEEEIIASLGKEKKKRKKRAKMKKKKRKKSKEDVYTFEEALLAAIENMKPKKIKKLLKGAEVTIKIRFEDEK